TLDPRSTALVLIDLQTGIVAGDTMPHASHDVVTRALSLARRFRELGALVVLVHVQPGTGGGVFARPAAATRRRPFDAGSAPAPRTCRTMGRLRAPAALVAALDGATRTAEPSPS